MMSFLNEASSNRFHWRVSWILFGKFWIGHFGYWALWGLGTLGVGDIVSYLRIPVNETPPGDEENLG